MAQVVKNLPVMQEICVQSLGQEDPLEKGIPLQYSGLENSMVGEFHVQRILVGYSSWRCKEWDTTKWLILSLSLLW